MEEIKEGWMSVYSSNDGWKKLFFVIQKKHLVAYPDPTDHTIQLAPLGLVGATIIIEDKFVNCFVVSNFDKSIIAYLSTASLSQRNEWIDALTAQTTSHETDTEKSIQETDDSGTTSLSQYNSTSISRSYPIAIQRPKDGTKQSPRERDSPRASPRGGSPRDRASPRGGSPIESDAPQVGSPNSIRGPKGGSYLMRKVNKLIF